MKTQPVSIQRAILILGALIVGLYGLLAAAGVYSVSYALDLSHKNHTALVALCDFRANLSDRADQTAAYIDDIKSGQRQPIPGITINDLQRSLDGQRATLKALDPLDC